VRPCGGGLRDSGCGGARPRNECDPRSRRITRPGRGWKGAAIPAAPPDAGEDAMEKFRLFANSGATRRKVSFRGRRSRDLRRCRVPRSARTHPARVRITRARPSECQFYAPLQPNPRRTRIPRVRSRETGGRSRDEKI
jgi:hypothetical protein